MYVKTNSQIWKLRRKDRLFLIGFEWEPKGTHVPSMNVEGTKNKDFGIRRADSADNLERLSVS